MEDKIQEGEVTIKCGSFCKESSKLSGFLHELHEKRDFLEQGDTICTGFCETGSCFQKEKEVAHMNERKREIF